MEAIETVDLEAMVATVDLEEMVLFEIADLKVMVLFGTVDLEALVLSEIALAVIGLEVETAAGLAAMVPFERAEPVGQETIRD